MAWIAVDKDGTEKIFKNKPGRYHEFWIGKLLSGGFNETFEESIKLPSGTIKKLIGRELTWEDEPIELK